MKHNNKMTKRMIAIMVSIIVLPMVVLNYFSESIGSNELMWMVFLMAIAMAGGIYMLMFKQQKKECCGNRNKK